MKRKNYGESSKLKLIDLSESSLTKDLKDPEFAAQYLEEILRDGSMDSFLLAIKNVAMANGGMKKLATNIGLGRESMYKALSKGGNPQFTTLQKVLKDVGLRFSIAKVS